MKYMNAVRRFGASVSRPLAVGSVLMLPAVSFAQGGIDVTAAVAEIAEAKVAALTIGAAVLGVAIAIMLYKWIRRAL